MFYRKVSCGLNIAPQIWSCIYMSRNHNPLSCTLGEILNISIVQHEASQERGKIAN